MASSLCVFYCLCLFPVVLLFVVLFFWWVCLCLSLCVLFVVLALLCYFILFVCVIYKHNVIKHVFCANSKNKFIDTVCFSFVVQHNVVNIVWQTTSTEHNCSECVDVCLYACVYVCMYVCMSYTCTYMRTYTHTQAGESAHIHKLQAFRHECGTSNEESKCARRWTLIKFKLHETSSIVD